MRGLLTSVHLNNGMGDKREWKIEASGRFTVQSAFQFLAVEDMRTRFEAAETIRKCKAPSIYS
ncbi:hypothetical protein Sjap_015173 [Stephania japonica]|uniref:Uncharacterized protein n=1 Tax=Stephania japonica TaxID=461633 RepID=A0AAP0IIL8_9MAGN